MFRGSMPDSRHETGLLEGVAGDSGLMPGHQEVS